MRWNKRHTGFKRESIIGTGTTSDEWGSITYALGDIGGELA